ncbi:hypothetical protein ACS0TY_005825 [Phlomoides rotata]
MKREGRQHGMVRTYPIQSGPRPKLRYLNELTSAPTAGTFTRVPTKPTNHSKFTGKCGRRKCDDCHVTPASKSKDKVKGAQKMRSSPQVLITWRVVDDARPGFNASGFKSATAVLDYLDDHHDHDYGDDHDDESYDHEIEEIDGVDHVVVDDDAMSFCEVGFVCQEIDGDESWCFVEEM